MKEETLPGNSHMFIMRIWVKQEDEEGEEEQGEEVHSFRNWASLVDAIQGMLTPQAQGPDAKAPSAHKECR
jgi:hypothetical protein